MLHSEDFIKSGVDCCAIAGVERKSGVGESQAAAIADGGEKGDEGSQELKGNFTSIYGS